MVYVQQGPDDSLLRLRRAARADDASTRTRALRELLRMDWHRAREAVLASLAEGAWHDRIRVLEALAGRGDPLAREALPWARDAAGSGAAHAVGRALAEVAAVLLRHDQGPLAQRLCAEALALEGTSPLGLARAQHVSGAAHLRARDAHAAHARLQTALAAYQTLGEAGYAARALDSLGSAFAAMHDLAAAERAYTESLGLKERIGDLGGQAITLGGLGRLAFQRGDLEAADDYFARDLALSQRLGDDEGMTVMANQLGEVWLARAAEARRDGDEALARAHLSRARQHVDAGVLPARRGGSLRDEAFSLSMQGRVALAEGRSAEGDRLLAQASERFAIADEAAACHGIALLRAEAARLRGDLDAARAHVDDALVAFVQLGSIDGQVRAWMERALQLRHAHAPHDADAARARAEALAATLAPSPTTRRLDALRTAETFVDALRKHGFIDANGAASLLTAWSASGASMGQLARASMPQGAYATVLREALDIAEATDAALASPAPEALRRLPRRAAERLCALPLRVEGETLYAAVVDPLDTWRLDQLTLLSGGPTRPVYAPNDAVLQRAIFRAYGRWLDLARLGDATAAFAALRAHAEALGARALVLDPADGEVSVRLRVDGVMREVDRVAPALGAALDAAAAAFAGEASGAHRSTLPTEEGPRVALTWPTQQRTWTLAEAGFNEAHARALAAACALRDGVVLVVGGVESGRSVTLEALRAQVDAVGRCVVRVEPQPDSPPVPGLVRHRTLPDALPETLAALAAQPVDVVVLDGLTDGPGLVAALQFAAEGRLVLAVGSLAFRPPPAPWAAEAGLPGADALVRVVVHQQLVRRLCPRCRVPDAANDLATWLQTLSPDEDLLPRLRGVALATHSPEGCAACHGLGYRGQALVYGWWTPDAADRRSVAAAAVEALATGITSRQELRRVLG